MKTCKKCGETRPPNEFAPVPRNRDGLSGSCNACLRARVRAYQHRIKQERGDEIKAHRAAYRVANYERVKAQEAAWVERNMVSLQAARRARYRANKEQILKAGAARYAAMTPEQKAHHAKSSIAFHKRCPEYRYERDARHRAMKMQRMPAWASAPRIAMIYKAAKAMRRMGLDVQVDHKYPLLGELVSGLHVHQNLAITSTQFNRRKSNRVVDQREIIEAMDDVSAALCTADSAGFMRLPGFGA